MGKTTGFLEYERQDGFVRKEADRVGDFREFHEQLSQADRQKQAARCMDCGIPFCQFGFRLPPPQSGSRME